MHRQLPRLTTALVLAWLVFAAPVPHQAEATNRARNVPSEPRVLRQIHRYQRETWRWQTVMGVRRTRSSRTVQTASRLRVRNLWRRRAVHARRRASHPPHRAAWLCIHRYEGAWADANPPYYGGLQMDIGFQRTYGRRLLRRKGTADHWTRLEQMWVAERAHRSGLGFYPWPSTARVCGLI
ncbi:MAG TPA: hypothetical protein VGQ68_09040 [Gaiellaceae bacterium]|nr:hypothetical protein [Gaiellaceae bacterium]